MSTIFGWDIVDSSSFIKDEPVQSLHTIARLATDIERALVKLGCRSLQFRGDGAYFLAPSGDYKSITAYKQAVQEALSSAPSGLQLYAFSTEGEIIVTEVGELSEAFWRIDKALKQPDQRLITGVDVNILAL